MPKRRFKLKAVLAGTCLLCLFSCQTGAKHYKAAIQLDQAGNYKNAVAYLEEAIKLDPSNQEYRDALEKINSRQISLHLAEAREQLKASPMTVSALSDAKRSLTKATAIDGSNAEVLKLSSQINSIQDEFHSDINSVYEAVKNHMQANEWKQAYFNLQQLQSRFPAYEDSIQLKSAIVEKGAAYYQKQAQVSLEQNRISDAITFADDALALDLTSTLARELLETARQRDNAGYFMKQANAAFSHSKWQAAIGFYKKALEYEPGNAGLNRMINRAGELASEEYISKAAAFLDEGYLFRGIENYKNALELVQSSKTAQKTYSLLSLENRLVTLAQDAARGFEDQGQYGSAWYLYKKINEINPQTAGVFYSIQSMKDKINERIKKAIAVFDFDSPSDQQDAGIIIANHLITYLFNTASKDIKILERENLKSILEEMKLGQVGVVNQNSANKMGKVYGIDVAIMGSVLLYNVEEQVSTGQKTVRYKMGTHIVDNIDFLNWQARHPNPTAKELKTAPQAKIKEPVYVQKDYLVSRQKKIGSVQLSFRIVDVATGENIKVDTIEVKRKVEDEGSAGLAEANIKYDPIEIMTDSDLLQDITRKAVAELGREALTPLQAIEKTYFDEAENYLKRREELIAAEYYINAMFDERMKMISNSPISRECGKRLHDIFYNRKILVGE